MYCPSTTPTWNYFHFQPALDTRCLGNTQLTTAAFKKNFEGISMYSQKKKKNSEQVMFAFG